MQQLDDCWGNTGENIKVKGPKKESNTKVLKKCM